MLRTIATISATVLLLAAAGNAHANFITFNFEGATSSGSSFTGSYTFDSTTSDASGGDDLLGTYTGAIVAMDIALGDLTASATAPPSAPGDIIVRAAAPGQYEVLPVSPLSGNTVAGTTLTSFGFKLFGVELDSDALPTSPPVYLESSAQLDFNEGDSFAFGRITSISTTTVPEPASFLLLGLALILVAPKVRRTR